MPPALRLNALRSWAAVALIMTLPACTSSKKSQPAPKIFDLPASVASDCSRAVDREIEGFVAGVPNRSVIRFRPGGCYRQDLTIVVADRVGLVIDGQGATFQKPAIADSSRPNNANWRVAGGRDVSLRNMVILGGYLPPTRGTPGQGQFTDHGVSLWGAVDASVSDVSVSNVDGECVTADSDIRKGTDYRLNPPSRNVVIDRLRCAHAGRQGVGASAVDGFTLSNSDLDDIQQNGVDIEIDVEGELARNVKITGNSFGAIYFAAISVPVGASPDVGDIEIRGNQMRQPSDSCFPAVFVGDPRFRLRGITVADNSLLTIGDGIRLTNVDSGSVTGNQIRNTAPSTGCDNANLSPPHSVGVRLIESTVSVESNLEMGFRAP